MEIFKQILYDYFSGILLSRFFFSDTHSKWDFVILWKSKLLCLRYLITFPTHYLSIPTYYSILHILPSKTKQIHWTDNIHNYLTLLLFFSMLVTSSLSPPGSSNSYLSCIIYYKCYPKKHSLISSFIISLFWELV